MTRVRVEMCNNFFFFFATSHNMWDFSSPARDGICTPCSGSTEFYLPNHGKVPRLSFLKLQTMLAP